MKHAVIVAHPRARSFTIAMAQTYAAAVRGLGHQAEVRDLYRLHFDPRLMASEVLSDHRRPGSDVAIERAMLADADVFAFFYPLWFNAPPAMIKGYIDRVFSHGFGFDHAGGVQEPRLVDRQLISFTSSGAPESWVRETGAFGAVSTLFDRHFAQVCGLRLLDHVHFGSVIPGYPPEAMEASRRSVREAVDRNFASLSSGPG